MDGRCEPSGCVQGKYRRLSSSTYPDALFLPIHQPSRRKSARQPSFVISITQHHLTSYIDIYTMIRRTPFKITSIITTTRDPSPSPSPRASADTWCGLRAVDDGSHQRIAQYLYDRIGRQYTFTNALRVLIEISLSRFDSVLPVNGTGSRPEWRWFRRTRDRLTRRSASKR